MGSPRNQPDPAWLRLAHGSHRAAPWLGALQSVQRDSARRDRYRLLAASFLRSGSMRSASRTAQVAHRDPPSVVTPPHRPHEPAARRAAYRAFSDALREILQGSHVAPPSTGGSRPHRVQLPAAARSARRFRPAARESRLFFLGSRPPYWRPDAAALRCRARSASRRLARQGSQLFLPLAGGTRPQVEHRPAAARAAARRR